MKCAILIILISTSLNLFAQKELREFRKGEFRLKLGLPYLNHLFLKPNNMVSIDKAGFGGESIGVEYSYSNDQFVEFNFSFVGVGGNPIPLSIDKEGAYTTQNSSYFSLTNNRQKGRFTYGYGINYSINTWAEGFRSFQDSISSTSNKNMNIAMGMTLNSYNRIGNSFNIGLIYRPTYIRQKKSLVNKYEHLVRIELLWRIRFNKK